MSEHGWSASPTPRGPLGAETIRQFQWLIIALVLAASIVVAALVLRPHPAPPPVVNTTASDSCYVHGGVWTGTTCVFPPSAGS
jgi:hypothetical protein